MRVTRYLVFLLNNQLGFCPSCLDSFVYFMGFLLNLSNFLENETALPCKGERSVSPFRRDIERWGDERGVRPLGIPVMRDRAVQALAKAALEPEWEAKFENNSYGFRPGRSAHDLTG